MAQIQKQQIVITLSKLVKKIDPKVKMAPDDLLSSLESVIEEFLEDKSIIVDVEELDLD